MNLLLPVSVCAIGAVLSIESSHINTIININIDIDIAIDSMGADLCSTLGDEPVRPVSGGLGPGGACPCRCLSHHRYPKVPYDHREIRIFYLRSHAFSCMFA